MDHNPLVQNRTCSVESSSHLFPLSTQSSFPLEISVMCFIKIISEIFCASKIECNPYSFIFFFLFWLTIKTCTWNYIFHLWWKMMEDNVRKRIHISIWLNYFPVQQNMTKHFKSSMMEIIKMLNIENWQNTINHL